MERNEPLEVLNGHNGLDSEGGNVGDTSQSKNHLSQINTNEINPDSPTHESDDHVDNSQLIREATAAAIDDAVKMKRSDSILSESDDGANDSLEDDITSSPPTPGVLQRRSTSAYIEAASVEASLSPIHHRRSLRSAIDLRFSGSSTGSSLDKSGKDLEINEVSGESERDVFHGMLSANFESLDLQLDTIVSCPSEETTHEVPSTQDLSEILESCGLQIPLQSSPFSDDVVLLHALFEDFCNPPLDIQNVENVLEMERGQDTAAIKLPMDVVIHMPSNVLVKLLGPTLLSLPKDFAMAMFRILLRLLTNDTDAEYDSGILVSCTWYDEMFAASPADPPELTRQRTSSSTGQSSFSEKAFNRNSEARKVDQMYTMVRLQRNWSDAVSQVLRLLKSIIHDKQHEYLQAPVTRLLGLLCTGSVAVSELRQILELSADSNNSPKTRLLLVRALRIAAAGASRASLLVGKASPRHFFSFVSGEGISRTISLEKSSWPFKNDFGMALWFRAEYFSDSSTVFRATDQSGNGTEISLLPVMKRAKGPPTATVLAISILEAGKAVHCIKVSKCVLHARVWYHVSVRHTRSRLKGVFSLASREQVSVILDGKNMVTESLAFPRIYESSLKRLHLTFGASFNGQTGGLYVFHENVSDATFKALYEMTAETNGVVSNRATAHGEWDSQRGDIVRKSRVLDLSMHRDDVEDIVLSDSKEHLSASAVVDIEEEDESFENGPLSKTSFNSKLYLVWDPRRTETNVALELHSGAHVRMNIENVQPWTVQGAQDVISSIGGVQALLPVFRSLLSGDIEKKWLSSAERNNQQLFENAILCSSVPDLLFLLASFVRDHNENAREMLRCGGIDIVEQFLHSNKNLGKGRSCSPASSLVAVLSTFPRLSTLLVDSMLELRSACSHYVGLETKVFSRLLFNLPLWFGRLGSYVSLYTTLFPVLSSITRNNPEKVRDCVGIKDMTQLAKELIELEVCSHSLLWFCLDFSLFFFNLIYVVLFFQRNDTLSKVSLFQRETHNLSDLQTKLTLLERRHVVDVLLGMIFQVLGVGSCCADDLSQFLNMISYFLESEWDQSSREVAGGVKDVTRSGVREDKYIFTLKACTILLFLFQIRPTVPGFFESFAGACGSVPSGAAWILSAMVNSYCDRMRSIGVRCIVSYVERTAQNPEQPLSLGKTLMLESDKTKNLDNRSIQENTLSLISNVGQGFLNSNVGKGLAATVRSRLLSPSKLTAGVVYKLLWHLLKSHRYRMGHGTQASLTSMVFERNVASFTTFDELKTHFLAVDHLFRDSVTINMAWTKKVLEDTHIGNQVAIRDSFGISTLMRLLRFLPDKFTDQWLSILVRLSSETLSVVEALSLCPDWQPCLFQFISELMEKISGLKSKISGKVQRSEQSGQELMVSGESPSQNKTAGPKTSFEPSQSNLDVLIWRLDLALRLYAGLLGHRIREGGDKVSWQIYDEQLKICGGLSFSVFTS